MGEAKRRYQRAPDCMMPDGGDPCAAFTEIYEELREARAEVARLETDREGWRTGNPVPPQSGWRDIASAPKDGTEILGWNRHLGRHIVSWAVQPQHNPHPAWISSTCRINHIDKPTHWMPLPPPPHTGDST